MEFTPKKVYEILKANGVDYIYHANSVLTSCQFLRKGALISRGTIDRIGLLQTPQSSDEIDKNYSIWFDVFTDSVDIHKRINDVNYYGPVLFKIRTEIIKGVNIGNIWVTKLNPTNWQGKAESKKWFKSHKELYQNFKKGEFGQMIVLRHSGGELPIKEYLDSIILDNPQLKTKMDGISYFSLAYGALSISMTESGIDAPIIKRICPKQCKCTVHYKKNYERTKMLFFPQYNNL